MLKYEGTDKIRDIKYEDGYVDKIYYDNNTLLVFTSDKEKTGVDEVLFKGRKLVDVTSYGKCEQNGTPTQDNPVDIVCNNGVLKFDSVNQEIYTDGTVETINIHGKNLFIPSIGTADGLTKELTSDGRIHISGTCTRTTGGFGIGSYVLPAGTYTLQCAVTGNAGSITSITFNSLSSCHFGEKRTVSKSVDVSSSAGISVTLGTTYDFYLSPMIEQGSTATDYVPYYDGGTATAEMLLKVGDYQDEQEIISGAVTRKVGVKVLNGTENWIASAASNNLFYSFSAITNADTSNNYKPISTHFNGVLGNTGYTTMQVGDFKHGSNNSTFYFKIPNITTAAECTQWLANQYAAGTPVIVVYPLTTPTIEQVEGQQLTIQQGNNIIEVTQASVDDILLKVKYK